METMKNSLIAVISIFTWTSLFSQTDAYYVNLIAQNLGGKTEVFLDGGRADVVTETYAIEVEFAKKWKESVGQALFYAQRTNKKAGIVLVMQSLADSKYGIMLQSTLDYMGLQEKVKVWFYPEDFGETFDRAQITYSSSYNATRPVSTSYTRNTNSGVRHNAFCGYANCTNCVSCGPNDGKKACGKCGG
jgi:hypothetical protein